MTLASYCCFVPLYFILYISAFSINFRVNSVAVCGNCIVSHPKYKLEYTTVKILLVSFLQTNARILYFVDWASHMYHSYTAEPYVIMHQNENVLQTVQNPSP
jgi:Zn-finger protein